MRQILKSILSTLGLLGLSRALVVKIKRPLRHAVNFWLILKNRLRGGMQADFFEELMDRRARFGGIFGKPPEAVTGWPDQPRRQYAVNLFLKHGWVTPDTRLMDYGCGNAATGVHFIRVLGKGKYTGVDLSSQTLARAREWVEKMALTDKKPEFIHLKGGSLAPLAGHKFDVVFSQDVIVHMSPDLIVNLIRASSSFIAPNGVFLCSYTHSDQEIEDIGDLMNWHHNIGFFQKTIEGTRLACEEVKEWSGIDYKSQPLSRLVRFSLKTN